MGVPKFFRYTSERYPCLNELVKQYQIPDFDNMYLDMNGIIHNCSHPDDSNPHFRITEEKIFQDIFHYLSTLFQIIKPKKLFFMAIDGVAPRAKMNQQRGRRFRSAREAENIELEAKNKGETLPTEKRFDSNCITPGTVFMARLHEQLKYFVKHKMSTDPLWAHVKVILSGHETPGEGEHKIMDYIRWARSQSDYDPNTRHCLYGLDADLVMLGMCTHEPHFALLREEVKFGKTTQRATSPEETNFYLLHLSLLREYLAQEFIDIKDKLPFEYDLEKIVDDWVLMGFLVGNDFIPHLPNMHISNDAAPLLYRTYMKILPTLSGYINEGGDLNLERFEIFMQELAKIDREKFQDTYADLKYFEAKTGRRPNANERREYKPNNEETFNVNVEEIKANPPSDELQALINATDDIFLDDIVDIYEGEESEETSEDEANIEMEFILHKKDYYMNKLDYRNVTESVLADQAEGYVRAIQWNLHYYYKGCPSWCWYYPHHYAPYMSDIKGFKDLKIEFELGEPFKPFEQLLAVLPAASKNLLPTPFHHLMTDTESPIVHYYPVNFETDLNGKKNDWEAVVLIPFIDEVNLLSAMQPCYPRLTEEETKRNTHGPMCVYNWTAKSLGPVSAPEYFPTIQDCHATETLVCRQELYLPDDKLKRGMLPNAYRDLVFPGFPTMKHLKYKTSLKKCRVKVFDQPSRNENMIVEVIPTREINPPLEDLAKELLGKVMWVGWPHLTNAKIISVSNEKERMHYVNNPDPNSLPYTVEKNSGNLHKQWIAERSTVIEHNMNRLGIELGDVKVLVHALNLKGYKYMIQDNATMNLEPEWCGVSCGYAYQTLVRDVSAHVTSRCVRFATPQQAYPRGALVFLTAHGQYYGARAEIVDSDNLRSGRIKVQLTDVAEPSVAARPPARTFIVASHAAAQCGISPQLMSRITGTILVVLGPRNDRPTETQDKLNLGLNLKFTKKNLEVSGYTRRCLDTNSWLYSPRCVQLVKSYADQFPELFDYLLRAKSMSNDIFFEQDIWPYNVGEKKPQEVIAWLKAQPHSKAVRRECGSEALEPEEMVELAKDIDEQLLALKGTEKKVTISVKWNLLYNSDLHEGNIPPDPKADFKLYDRVVCVARGITVPAGRRGTVTAILPPPQARTVRLSDTMNAEPSYQILLDEPCPGAAMEDLFDTPRHYRMLPTNMLNISFGRGLRASTPTRATRDDPLRAHDGHHSAFASYSPPVDTTQDIRNKVTSNGKVKQDDPTVLLKNLLKISEDNSSTKKNKTEQNLNWRAKEENNTNSATPPRPQQQQRYQPKQPPQPQNWRTESSQPTRQPTANEWNNTNYKNQPPMPPYPSFGPQFQGPGPAQISFPQFQNPHFQRGNQGFQGNQDRSHGNQGFQGNQDRGHGNQGFQGNQDRNHGNQGFLGNQDRSHGNQGFHGNQRLPNQQPFPLNLPNVNSAAALAPNWLRGPDQHSTPASTSTPISYDRQTSADKLSNPFVPLQVQTSQRRVRKPIGTTTKSDAQEPAGTVKILPRPPDDTLPIAQPQDQSTKPTTKKKKKPRIAANLPFQLD